MSSHSIGQEDSLKKKVSYAEVLQEESSRLDSILQENWEKDIELSLFFQTQSETT